MLHTLKKQGIKIKQSQQMVDRNSVSSSVGKNLADLARVESDVYFYYGDGGYTNSDMTK